MPRRRTIVVISAAAVLVGAGAYAGYRLSTGGQVTEIGIDDAVRRFREQTTGATATTMPPTGPPTTPPAPVTSDPPTPTPTPSTVPPPVASLPPLGVYQYATTGFDEVDALTGARHDYPEVTTLTVTPHDCGVRLRWDVAVERWNTWDWCLVESDDGDESGHGAGIRQTGWVGYHEFFGVGGRNDYLCEGDPRPLVAPAGTTWSMTCRMDDRTTSVFTGIVIGPDVVTVDGSPIEVLHLRYDVEVDGESIGTQTIEGWYRTTDGLPVREVVSVATQQSTVIGTTNFTESATIELLTPTPSS